MDAFNYDKLREDLIDYFGTAIVSGNLMARGELSIVEKCNNETLLLVAINNGFDLNNYIKNKIR